MSRKILGLEASAITRKTDLVLKHRVWRNFSSLYWVQKEAGDVLVDAIMKHAGVFGNEGGEP